MHLINLKNLTKTLTVLLTILSLTTQQPKNPPKKDPYKTKITHIIALSIKIGKNHLKTPIILGLFGNETPKTVKNFYNMCTMPNLEKNGLRLSYINSTFHRVIPYFMIQGGDITRGNGEGGWSIYGSTFKDENFNVFHDVGTLSMANSGRDSNNSQFFISTEKIKSLDGRYVVFGIVVKGMDVVYLIEGSASEGEEVPKEEVVIVDCYDPTKVQQGEGVEELELGGDRVEEEGM